MDNKLALRYISASGIPLGQHVKLRPEDTSLEDRVQILETLLGEYYLDTHGITQMMDTKKNYQKLENEKHKYASLKQRCNCKYGTFEEDDDLI